MAVHDSAGVTTVAEAYLSVLSDRGVRRLFVNAGTDFAPVRRGVRPAEAIGTRSS